MDGVWAELEYQTRQEIQTVTLNLDRPQIGSGWNEYFNVWPVILFHAVILGPPCARSCLASKGKPHCYTKEGCEKTGGKTNCQQPW